MVKAPENGARRRIAIALLLATATPAAIAQYPAARYPEGAVVQQLPHADDPAERLATALRTLAVEPNNVEALTAAGQNALILGDPNAAVGFFGRAGELAPRDGRVKAGLGSALVQLEKPQDALRLFGEASALGVPDETIAEDRGLAYDLTGDNRRAQRDYTTVLTAHPEDDTARRRLALSQGIAGDRKAAIATLDPLIRKRDIAGWRAQTFVLAMTGDTKGASDITHIMLPSQADMLQPFLVRLSGLSPADKAKAVHFGEMPSAGRPYTPSQLANIGTPATYASSPAPTYAPPPRRAEARPAPVAVGTAAVAASQPSDLAPVRAASATAPAATATVRPPVESAAAPLSGIALSPAPSATPAASQPVQPVQPVQPAQPIQIARAEPVPAAQAPVPQAPSIATVALPPSSSVAASPAASTAPSAALPMPEAPAPGFGHYDLPHDAAAHAPVRSMARAEPIRPAPARPEAAAAEPAKIAPVQPAPVTVETVRPEPIRTAPPRTDTAKTEYLPDTFSADAARPATRIAEAEPVRTVGTPIVHTARPAETDGGKSAASATISATIAPAAAPKPAPRTVRATKPLDRVEPDGAAAVDSGKSTRHGSSARTDTARKGAADDSDTGTPASARLGKDLSSPKSAKADDGGSDATADTSKSGRSAHGGRASGAKAGSRFDAAADDGTTGSGTVKGRKGKADTGDDSGSAKAGRSTKAKAGTRDSGKADDTDSADTSGKHGRYGASSDKTDRTDKADTSAKSGKSSKGGASDKGGKSDTAGKSDKSGGTGERVYVQVAGGANKDDMDKAWSNVKQKAPDLMKGHSPSTTPLRATNRLLVGPFKTDDEAQAFVNKMAGKGLSGFVFKSAKGQKIDKVDGGK